MLRILEKPLRSVRSQKSTPSAKVSFLAQTRSVNHFVRESSGEITVAFGYVGHVIPLIKFNTRINNNGQVVTQVKRSGAAATLDHAFSAQMGGHRGI